MLACGSSQHRYIAISDLSNLNEDFDYPMELRSTMFSESKAQQMIWQKDQKTKMRKIESDSLNQNNFANQVINFIILRGRKPRCFSRGGFNDGNDVITVYVEEDSSS